MMFYLVVIRSRISRHEFSRDLAIFGHAHSTRVCTSLSAILKREWVRMEHRRLIRERDLHDEIRAFINDADDDYGFVEPTVNIFMVS